MAAQEVDFYGHVQGVGFRWTAKKLADGLGLTGWVRNNDDGSVSIRVEGEPAKIHSFINSLESSFGNRVTERSVRDVEPGKNRDGFDVVR